MFYNEVDLLEIRLNELNDVVDYFVIVEGERTHQNKPKEMLFQKNIHKYEKFLPKIIHVIVDADKFRPNDPMYNDVMQRNHITYGLENATDDDLIIISDLDEIPSSDAVKIALKENKFPVLFNQILHYYYLNTQAEDRGSTLSQSSCMLRKNTFLSNTQITRHNKHQFHGIENGGWHFSFLGNKNHVLNKLQNYAHDDWKDESLNAVENRLEHLIDPLNRNYIKLKCIADLSYLPKYVLNNMDKFKKYIKD
jgi:beta-1,4-mannosyl-glycoprotein beta-1,4-N-acetylglucosaminyltransferase